MKVLNRYLPCFQELRYRLGETRLVKSRDARRCLTVHIQKMGSTTKTRRAKLISVALSTYYGGILAFLPLETWNEEKHICKFRKTTNPSGMRRRYIAGRGASLARARENRSFTAYSRIILGIFEQDRCDHPNGPPVTDVRGHSLKKCRRVNPSVFLLTKMTMSFFRFRIIVFRNTGSSHFYKRCNSADI